MASRPQYPRLATRICFGLAVLSLGGNYGLNESEIKCEQAVEHLRGCCEALQSHVFNCNFISHCEGARRPDFSSDLSECLMAQSCAELQSAGQCDTATWPYPKGPACP